ncbi:site-specific tyrosine recombinase XerD [compost metagenome]
MHVKSARHSQSKADVTVTQWEALPQFLSMEQLFAIRSCNVSPGRRLLLDLMTRVGLRSVEARTFALKYVFNPYRRKDCAPDRMIRIRLDPRDMMTKFNKPRDVDIPFSLMNDLHAYTLHERNRLANEGEECSALILTTGGRKFTKDGIGEVCASISKRVGFKFNALMLRHSYAVHTLRRLRQDPNFHGEPLLYLRDRMGHSSVQTTTIYLRQIEQLAGGLALAVEDEFDAMFQRQLDSEKN